MSISFFIIGLPKAGTSSLFNWLNDHPQLCGSTPKETFFLMDKECPLLTSRKKQSKLTVHELGLTGYANFFKDCDPSLLKFEATPHYFYQNTARQYISQMEPKPLVIFILRQPSRRIYSSFKYTQENLGFISRELTFDSYVDYMINGEKDVLSQYFLNFGSLYVAQRELDLSNYTYWLDLWSDSLGKDKVEVLIFENLIASPLESIKKLAIKIGVDPSFYDNYNFNVYNQTYTVKSQLLQRIANQWARIIPSGKVKQLIKRVYMKIQERKTDLKLENDTFSEGLKKLDSYCQNWVEELSSKYNLNIFDIWR